MTNLLNNLKAIGLTDGTARAAYTTWALIKHMGYDQAKASLNYSTFSKHRAWLLKAGLTHTDLQNSENNVLVFKRKTIVLDQPVTSWSQVMRLVA